MTRVNCDQKLRNCAYMTACNLLSNILSISASISRIRMRNWQSGEITTAYILMSITLFTSASLYPIWMRNWQTVLTMTAFILMSIIFFTSAAISLIRMRPSFLITSTSISWYFCKHRSNTFITKLNKVKTLLKYIYIYIYIHAVMHSPTSFFNSSRSSFSKVQHLVLLFN